MHQAEAWEAYDRWLADDAVSFVDEPSGLDRRFRALTRAKRAAPQAWADAYLAAFAETSQLTLVTFDRAFRGKCRSLLLLEA
jgi:predicted nucleic acid-binding protein